MNSIELVQRMFHYSEWANDRLLEAARALTDFALDRPFEIGVGSLRKTLLHLFNGEAVWLQRWQGRRETPWPDEMELASVDTITQRFRPVYAERDRFLRSLNDLDLASDVTYRDSKGSLYTANLADMLLQGFNHSTHHRAQAVNMLRHVGGAGLELDYMYSLRRPAGE